MSAQVKFIKPEYAEILRQYLDTDGVALVFPEAQERAKELGIEDGAVVDCDFGGDPDVWVEKIESVNHIFLDTYGNDDSEPEDDTVDVVLF